MHQLCSECSESSSCSERLLRRRKNIRQRSHSNNRHWLSLCLRSAKRLQLWLSDCTNNQPAQCTSSRSELRWSTSFGCSNRRSGPNRWGRSRWDRSPAVPGHPLRSKTRRLKNSCIRRTRCINRCCSARSLDACDRCLGAGGEHAKGKEWSKPWINWKS